MPRPRKTQLGKTNTYMNRGRKCERVWWNNQWHYLGLAGSKAARAKYARLAAIWAADPTAVPLAADDYLVAELFADYLASADSPPGGQQRDRVVTACDLLLELFPDTAASSFRGVDLEAWQHWLCNLPDTKRAGRTRYAITSVKDLVWCVRRVWKWGVRKRGIPAERYDELLLTEWPKIGQARAPKIVEPADPDHVRAALPHLRRPVRAMVILQLAAGGRPAEVCGMTPGGVHQTGKLHVPGAGVQNLDKLGVWAYLPPKHKLSWKAKPRFLLFGPDAQKVLAPFLDRHPDAYCFAPAESLAELRAEQRADRAARDGGSGGDRKTRAENPRRRPTTRYTPASYRQAVARACDAAGVPRWTPYQLRHLAASEVKEMFDHDAVKALLGHHTQTMAEHYGGQAFKKAASVAKGRAAG